MTETPSRSNNVAAGRTTSVVTSAGTTTLAYDYEGRISTITYPSSATNSFTYNGLDTRVGKVDSAGTTTYRRDGDDVLSPVLEAGGTKFTPGISRRTGTSSYFYHQDRMGSAVRQTNSTQGSLTSRQYDAFGNVAYVGGTWVGPFGFVGGEGYQEDSDSGLQLLGHRYYDPSTGRFLTRDKVKAGLNWYVYCENNTLVWSDATGLDKLILHENSGGFGMGSHLIIGLGDDDGNNTVWYGFYPNPPSRGSSSSSGSSGSSGSPSGPGHVQIGDKPTPGKESTVTISPEERQGIADSINVSHDAHKGKRGRPYQLVGYNCADWAARMIEKGLGDNLPSPRPTPKSSAPTTPRQIREWIVGWER